MGLGDAQGWRVRTRQVLCFWWSRAPSRHHPNSHLNPPGGDPGKRTPLVLVRHSCLARLSLPGSILSLCLPSYAHTLKISWPSWGKSGLLKVENIPCNKKMKREHKEKKKESSLDWEKPLLKTPMQNAGMHGAGEFQG